MSLTESGQAALVEARRALANANRRRSLRGGPPQAKLDAYADLALRSACLTSTSVVANTSLLLAPGTGAVLRHNRMRVTFSDATLADVPALVDIHNDVATALTTRFGKGHWSSVTTERGTAHSLQHAKMRVGRSRGRIVTVLRLATKKPWAIDIAYFTPVKRPLYLTGMAVVPSLQQQGLGRQAMDDAHEVALAWPADAIRLDAYDSPAGAGDFYSKCGYAERGHIVYKTDPLVYYELVLR